MDLYWNPPVELSASEQRIAKRCKARKLFFFLRHHRHELFDHGFQQELVAMYGPQPPGGTEPVPPALLAMVTLLQAGLHVGDADAVEEAEMNARWKLVLGTLGSDDAPFSQGTLQKFRQRLMAHDMDKRLLDRTVELARTLGGFGHRNLRAAFDSSPLFGAGRVEDTFNLLGHAAREVVRTAARRLGRSFEEVASQAGIPVLTATSIKAGLDIDWDLPKARTEALTLLVRQVESLSQWLTEELAEAVEEPPLKEQVETMERIIDQDTEPDPDGDGQRRRIRQGVAKERQISIRDPEMRHGRKSKASRVDGFKRHLAVDLETKLICAVALTPANRPEAEALGPMLADLSRQGRKLEEAYIDRGYLAATELEAQRRDGVTVHCKPYPLRNGDCYTKADFAVDLKEGTATCPQGVKIHVEVGATGHFPAKNCDECRARSECTKARSGRGRSLTLHPDEAVHQELRRVASTSEGRKNLRERVQVEHRLAHVGRSQGRRARYVGLRKNEFDLLRHAAVANLFTADRLAKQAA